MRFRKKPVIIEAEPIARLIALAANNPSALPAWVEEAYSKGNLYFRPQSIQVQTLEGLMTGDRESWLIRGLEGELYPCVDSVFRSSYEAVAG